ncbi:hypothetical protein CRG98_017953 [Punica granatum]|uniref:Uncharacterized protein n=1 Tax=Punica granatum TaxID=22663 RepID=A0A2I0JZA1_PUNGR|nr:hypothetical protein CRG98_017953 [Punica granatum]
MTLCCSRWTGSKVPFSIARGRWWLPMKKADKEDEDEGFFEVVDSPRIALQSGKKLGACRKWRIAEGG